MEENDIRWKQRFENFQKVLKLLKKSMDVDDQDEIDRGAVIHFFELTFEMAWKLLKDFENFQGFSENSPRSAIKRAFEMDLIQEGTMWLKLIEDRNLTTHAYDNEIAERIDFLIHNKYYQMFLDLETKFLLLLNE